ncbi:cholesterol oxidase substrate-binding domain-containing protein [Streptomyces sp. NBC_01190]|uniref:cholesterol oxidase substrate-binding domain-containing protein n=1 Tax=Streptomyces sp. NBC_01190 TaxID=2903767 RepID=UPI00386BD7D0|nr:FAD-binding protein [Streptomyces sp. NBC_01190]
MADRPSGPGTNRAADSDTDRTPARRAGLSRRRLPASSASLGAGAWLLLGTARPDSAHASAPAPPGFPDGPDLYQGIYQNWAGEIRTDALWTCAPRTPQDVLDVVNWACAEGWTVRAQGHRHGWAPLTVADAAPAAARVVLLDTTVHLTALSFASQAADGTARVRAQAGASLESLLAFAGGSGYGVTSAPAPGDLSVGGALAIDAHGTAVQAVGESAAGWAYTESAAWADPDVLGTAVPDSLRADGGPGWDEAVATLDRLDPHRVLSNPFLDGLLR